jgi:hypothetical protein
MNVDTWMQSRVGTIEEYNDGPVLIEQVIKHASDMWGVKAMPVEGPLTQRQHYHRLDQERWAERKRQDEREYEALKRGITGVLLDNRLTAQEATDRILEIHAEWCNKHHDY